MSPTKGKFNIDDMMVFQSINPIMDYMEHTLIMLHERFF